MKKLNEKTMPPCMILCGGLGSRLRDVTELLPKPMVPIGPQPIVWHIMKTYASFGVRRFILCLGYKSEVFIDYFLNYHERMSDFTISLNKNKKIVYHRSHHDEEDWEVTLAFTGIKTMTGGRVYQASKYLREQDTDFFLTYGDAVANVNFQKLYETHKRNNREITVTAVSPPNRYGILSIEEDAVTQFTEKPHSDKDLINGGFMVLKQTFVKKYIPDDTSIVFEKQPMMNAVADNQMSASFHSGFWQCMDVQREHEMLNKLWDQGNAPWTENWVK